MWYPNANKFTKKRTFSKFAQDIWMIFTYFANQG